MNEQEKVYKVIQAAVKKLQEKGVEINEEQFVQLIQDTYKKAATKDEGDKAVKDMFAEIFKDEQKMFKDGGKMESAVNLFKCGGKSKSKSSKKVEKRQEGGDIDETFHRYNHDGVNVKEIMVQDGYGEDWKRFDKTGQYYRSVIYPQDGYGADTTYSFYPTYGERYEIRANKDGRTGNFSNIYGEYKNLSKEEMSKIADMINKKVGNILSKQNGGHIQPDVSTPNQEILYKHHPGPHTPLIGVRKKYGEYISEPLGYEGVLKDGTRISAWGSYPDVERFKTANGNTEESFVIPKGKRKDSLADSMYSRTIVDPKTGSEWSESAWIAEDGKWRVRRWDPEYRRNVTPEEFKETIKRFREGWKNIESQNPAIIRITENND